MASSSGEMNSIVIRGLLFRAASATLLLMGSACSFFEQGMQDVDVNKEPSASAVPASAGEVLTDTEPKQSVNQNLAYQNNTDTPKRPSRSKTPTVVSSVEISWKVPVENIQFYHLHYGHSPDNLNRHVRIKTSSLEKLDDPIYGPRFRYELKGISTKVPLYYSLSAENSGQLSQPSPVMKLD